MEQRLNADYLKAGLIEKAIAITLGTLGAGAGVFLAAWGISSFWRITPPELKLHIANPELRVSSDSQVTVTQNRPFVIAQPNPIQLDNVSPRLEVNPPILSTGAEVGASEKTSKVDVITREVTVFSSVAHPSGAITTGWTYRDGAGRVPTRQYCYYSAPNADLSRKRIDIALNREPLANASTLLVPDLENALKKCQWWKPTRDHDN